MESLWIYWDKHLHDAGDIKSEGEGRGTSATWLGSLGAHTAQERDVIFERPPGGATIFCAVRRGMWSSI